MCSITPFCQEWDNPVFKNKEERNIKSTTQRRALHACGSSKTHKSQFFAQVEHSSTPGHTPERPRLPTSTGRFDKADLCTAHVIGQVNSEFVACVLYDAAVAKGKGGEKEDTVTTQNWKSRGPSLVVIDQHAADERIRVERFLELLCTVFIRRSEAAHVGDFQSQQEGVEQIIPPKNILLTRREADTIKGTQSDYRMSLWRWGIEVEIRQEVEATHEHVQVQVCAVPAVLKEKVRCNVVSAFVLIDIRP